MLLRAQHYSPRDLRFGGARVDVEPVLAAVVEDPAHAAARASARDAGLSLPERGYTYVRPHTRGDGTIEPHRVRVRRDR